MVIGQWTGREGGSSLRRARRALALTAALIVAVPTAAQAATVTNTADSGPGSLRDAIASSASGDTINFASFLNGQTITLTSGALLISHPLTISGPGASNLTLNGNNNDSVFDITAGNLPSDTVTISGLTITGGAFSGQGVAGGGGIFDSRAFLLTLSGVTVTGNQATVTGADAAGGGGVYADGGMLTITGSTITNNKANLTGASGSSNGGGGVYSNGGVLTITGSVVSGNSAVQTGTQSSDSDGGGGIYSDGGAVSVTNSVVTNNSSSVDSSQDGFDGGGGIYSDGGSVTLNGATVNGNTFTLSSSTVGENGGGGMFSNGGDVTMGASSIDGNTATISDDTSTEGENGGGGLFSAGGTVDISSSSISRNTGKITATAGANGGGGVVDQGRSSTYLNTTLSGNSVTINGGGAQDGGGAIYTFAGGLANDLTIAGNSINAPGGGIFSQGTFELRNTILAGDTGSPAGTCAGLGTFVSGGFNLESGNTCGLAAGGDRPNTDPKLGPLQNNGGPTPTQALSLTSPALDAGSCTDNTGAPVSTDQRGVARPQPPGGSCDIGAYERGVAPVVSSVNPGSGPAGGGTPVTITGSSFSGVTAVHFGANPAAAFTVVSDGAITATSPPGTGTVDVTVTKLDLTSATGSTDRFTYTAPPAALTGRPSAKTSSGATFSGSVDPGGEPTTYFFQYGLDPRLRPPGASSALYDQSTAPQTLPAGSASQPVSATVTGLVPNALYHVRLVAANASGTTFGPDQTFTTPAGQAPPPPVVGKSENAKPISGHVFVLIGGKLVPLTETRKLPSGTTVDARRGSLELIAAAPHSHKRQTGVFGGAIFKLIQTRAEHGLSTLSLVEGAFKGAPSYASCRRHGAGDGHAALSSRVLQTLHSRASGRFSTRGRYAAGTVRGTQWTTTDRCDGTLIAVQQHSVLVTDLVKHITVLVKAGHRYLARPRK